VRLFISVNTTPLFKNNRRPKPPDMAIFTSIAASRYRRSDQVVAAGAPLGSSLESYLPRSHQSRMQIRFGGGITVAPKDRSP